MRRHWTHPRNDDKSSESRASSPTDDTVTGRSGVATLLVSILAAEICLLSFGGVRTANHQNFLLASPVREIAVVPFPEIDQYGAIAARPIFDERRSEPTSPDGTLNPGAVATQRPPEKPISNDFILQGTSLRDGSTIALISSRSKKATELTRVGEEVNGWSVQEVTPRTVVLKRGAQTESLRFPMDVERARDTSPK